MLVQECRTPGPLFGKYLLFECLSVMPMLGASTNAEMLHMCQHMGKRRFTAPVTRSAVHVEKPCNTDCYWLC